MDNYDTKALSRLQSKLRTTPDGCQEFTGAGGKGKLRVRYVRYSDDRQEHKAIGADPLRFVYKNQQLNPKLVAYGLANNLDPLTLRLPRNTCNNRLCCNPEHVTVDMSSEKIKYLDSIGYCSALECGAWEVNQMQSDFVFTDAELEAYLAVA